MILHLATDTLVIAKVAGFSSGMNMIVLKTPLEIFPEHDPQGAVESFSLQPYLQPFTAFSEEMLYNINLRQVISVSHPNKVMIDTYDDALIQMFKKEDSEIASRPESDPPETPASDKPAVPKRILH